MRVSYLEIYNEQCYDLLDISTQPSDIAIVEDSKDRVIVKGLATPVAATEAEALQYLFEVLSQTELSVVKCCKLLAKQGFVPLLNIIRLAIEAEIPAAPFLGINTYIHLLLCCFSMHRCLCPLKLKGI